MKELAALILVLPFIVVLFARPMHAEHHSTDEKAVDEVGAKGSADEDVLDAKARATRAKAPAKAPTRGGPSDPTAIWWDDPGIRDVLSLSDDQRKQMTGYLKAYREKAPPIWKLESFHESLVGRQWDAARAESERIAEAAELSLRLRGQIKIDVLSVLTEKQHQLLVDQFPRLIYKPWTRVMRGGSTR